MGLQAPIFSQVMIDAKEQSAMQIQSVGEAVKVTAPAKLNLHLEVVGKRADGFHDLESLFVRVSLGDVLTLRSAPTDVTVICNDPTLTTGEDNLVTKAARLMIAESGHPGGVRIELEKQIPRQAGLGGGSSDAAATLAGLNQRWGLNWSNERLAELGARLGSDVPFFFSGPAAVVTGRGEQVAATPIGGTLHAVIVCPTVGLSTKEVFGRLKLPTTPNTIGPIVDATALGDWRTVGRLLFNRLEQTSLSLAPRLAALATQAKHWNCLGTRMTGSGSAWFALCETAAAAQTLATELRHQSLGQIIVVHSI